MAKYLDDNRRKIQGQMTGQAKLPAQPAVQKPLETQAKNMPRMQVQRPAVQTAGATRATPQSSSVSRPAVQNQPAPLVPAAVQGNDSIAQANQYLSQQLQGFKGTNTGAISELVSKLSGRQPFEYDVNTDPLYLQLRDIWKQDGLMAMEDTMGQAAQLTGGYGNSHAQMAGQQVYNNHLREVAEMVPQLKESARADYDAETNALLQQYDMLMQQDQNEYSRWLDEINRQYQMERDAIADQRYQDEWAYQQSRDQVADQRYNQEWEYQMGRDQIADQRYQDEWAYQKEQDAREWEYQIGRDAVNDQRYNQEWAYQQNRDQIADQRYDQEWQYQLEQDAIANQRYDQEWQYQQNRDQIADQRYDQEWQYQQNRDAVNDQRYNQEWEYQQSRDQEADRRYDQEWEYQQNRDAVNDQRYDQEWAYQQSRDQETDRRYDEEWQYQMEQDQIANQRYQEALAYDREQDAIANGRYEDELSYDRQQDNYDRLLELITATGYQPTAQELAAAGMSEAEARAWRGYYTGSMSGYGSGYGTNSTSKSNTQKVSDKQDDTPKPADTGIPAKPAGIPSPLEPGNPLKPEDYVSVYAACAKYAGNGAPTSQLVSYIKEALDKGSITQEEYKKLMAKFGGLADPGKTSSSSNKSSSSGKGKGSGVNNRYNTLN